MDLGKRVDLGKSGEDYAEGLLRRKGYRIITRNYKTKLGEIDIIALDEYSLVFVEVKTRFTKSYGKPEEAVGKKKLKRIERIGEYFLKINPQFPKKLRIDVVAINLNKGEIIDSKIIKVV